MKPVVILENIRSAYNVGNVIRTADALGYDVVLSGYTPSPFADDGKVAKTSLGAEENVHIRQFRNTSEALEIIKNEGKLLLAAEIVEGKSSELSGFMNDDELFQNNYAIVFGNEKTGVLDETLAYVDHIVHIPMQGTKASLNVGQAAAIMMWEFLRFAKLSH